MTSNELETFKQSILDDVRVMMQTTGQVTQYIGARYVPLISDPIEWSDQKEYEPLTIVSNQGNSYTSRQFVPKGTPITNEQFWANTGNFNAQIEQYRREVAAFDGRITAAQNAADSKAPINHATDSTEYGVGNSVNYGHVKLADSDTPATSADNDGIAATPKMVDLAKRNKLMIIGDSYTALSDSTWAEDFAKYTNMTLYKHAQSSSCYHKEFEWQTKEFVDMLVSDDYISSHKDELNMLICYGGLNDKVSTSEQKTAFNNAVNNFINQAHKTYPNAIIIIAGPQRAKDTPVSELDFKRDAMKTQCYKNNAIFIDTSAWQFFWPAYYGAYYSEDNTHPNAAGYKAISTSMINAIFGDGWKPTITTAESMVTAGKYPLNYLRIIDCGNKLIVTFTLEHVTENKLSFVRICHLPILDSRVNGYAAFNIYEYNTEYKYSGENIGHLFTSKNDDSAVIIKQLTDATITVTGEISFRV